MGVLTCATLLQEFDMVRAEENIVFSEELVHACAADKEIKDAMAPCVKLEMLALLGRSTFKLPELFSGLAMDSELADKSFLVPPGRLSAGDGLQDMRALSSAQVGETIKRMRSAIVAAVERLANNPDGSAAVESLEIGFTGVGSTGMASMIVLVEAGATERAWGLVIHSERSSGARIEYETVPGILRAMRSDLEPSHQLPQLPEEWTSLLETDSPDSEIPDSSPSAAVWDEAAWNHRASTVM